MVQVNVIVSPSGITADRQQRHHSTLKSTPTAKPPYTGLNFKQVFKSHLHQPVLKVKQQAITSQLVRQEEAKHAVHRAMIESRDRLVGHRRSEEHVVICHNAPCRPKVLNATKNLGEDSTGDEFDRPYACDLQRRPPSAHRQYRPLAKPTVTTGGAFDRNMGKGEHLKYLAVREKRRINNKSTTECSLSQSTAGVEEMPETAAARKLFAQSTVEPQLIRLPNSKFIQQITVQQLRDASIEIA